MLELRALWFFYLSCPNEHTTTDVKIIFGCPFKFNKNLINVNRFPFISLLSKI